MKKTFADFSSVRMDENNPKWEQAISRTEKIYTLKYETDYKNAIIDYISGMSDNFAIDVFNELISF